MQILGDKNEGNPATLDTELREILYLRFISSLITCRGWHSPRL